MAEPTLHTYKHVETGDVITVSDELTDYYNRHPSWEPAKKTTSKKETDK